MSTDFDALAVCLAHNAAHLRTLTLDLIDWEEIELGLLSLDETNEGAPLSSNTFATDVVGLKKDRLGHHFPCLEHLSLSEVSFNAVERELSHPRSDPKDQPRKPRRS